MNRRLGRGEIAASFVAVGLALVVSARGHEDWVDAAMVVLVVTGFLVEPLLMFAHELGHALAAVALTGQRVLIRTGGEPYLVRFALGKIDVRFHPTGYVAHCELGRSPMSPRHHLIVALAGPAVSIAVGAALVPVALAWHGDSPVLFWITALSAASSLFIGFGNAVPFRRLPAWWPGSLHTDEEGPSDGFVALHALRAHRSGENASSVGASSQDATAPRNVATARVHRVIARAADEAERLGSTCLGTEHLLLGLLTDQGTPACRVLERFGLTTERVRGKIPQSNASHDVTPAQEMRLTPAARRAVARAAGTLSLQGDEYVDTEHLLLGLIQDQAGLAMQALLELGVDSSELRRETIMALRDGSTKRGPQVSGAAVPGSGGGRSR